MPGYLKYLFSSILITAALAGLIWLAAWKIAGLGLFSVQSGSMRPVFSRGDLLIDTRPNDLHAGDIVSYASQQTAGLIVTHRITSQSNGYFITKGDNLKTADPPVPASAIKGRAILALPLAGSAFVQLRKPAGLIAIVYLPALAITAGELWKLTGQFKYRRYRLPKTT